MMPVMPSTASRPPGQIDVFSYVCKGFLLGDHGDQTGIAALPPAVDRKQHVGEAHHGIEHGVIEIQVDSGGPDCVDFPPHHLGDFLGHALIIPAAGTAEIPFRVIAEKTGHG